MVMVGYVVLKLCYIPCMTCARLVLCVSRYCLALHQLRENGFRPASCRCRVLFVSSPQRWAWLAVRSNFGITLIEKYHSQISDFQTGNQHEALIQMQSFIGDPPLTGLAYPSNGKSHTIKTYRSESKRHDLALGHLVRR